MRARGTGARRASTRLHLVLGAGTAAVAIWLAVYPSITCFLWMTGSLITTWPLPLRTLAVTGAVVPLVAFILLPTIKLLLGRWLA